METPVDPEPMSPVPSGRPVELDGGLGPVCIGLSLALGSYWGLAPAALASGLLVLRTAWEDRLLQAELPGYSEYAGRLAVPARASQRFEHFAFGQG